MIFGEFRFAPKTSASEQVALCLDPEDSLYIVVGEHPLWVVVIPAIEKIIDAWVLTLHVLMVEGVHLAPVWPTAMVHHDRLHVVEVGSVIHGAIYVHSDIATVPPK